MIVLVYVFVLHEQLSPLPWVASPHPLWRQASEVLGTPLEPSVSIARNQPLFALGAPLAAVLSLLCALVVCADHARARQLLQVVAWSGAAYAVLGVVLFVIDPTKILWREKQAYADALTSTFINRNTAAVYFGSCAIVWLLFLSEGVRRRLPRGEIRWRRMPNRVLSEAPREVALAFSTFFVCLAAMFMTGSRAGVVLSLTALVIAFIAFFFPRLAPPPRRSDGHSGWHCERAGPAADSGRKRRRPLRGAWSCRRRTLRNVPFDFANDRRASVVRDGHRNVRVGVSSVPQRQRFGMGHMGSGP
jgi:hypothetical protein